MKSHQLKVVGAAVALVLSLALSAAEAPFVSAHAGAMGTRANTLESVKALVKTKVDALELDIARRPSGLPVMIHNRAPKETEGEPLEPALEVMAASDKIFFIDFKCGDPAFKLQIAKMVAAKGMGARTIFSCHDPKLKEAILAICPGAKIVVGGRLSANPTPAELAHLDRLAALKPWAYNTCHAWLSPAAAAALKARGLRISLWTANSPESFDKFVKQGAYNVTTTWIPPKLVNPAPAKSQTAAEAPFVSAHAGAMGTRANTLESVKALVKTDVDALELDIARRPSGLPVMIHNTAPKETEGDPLEPALDVMAASNKRFLVDFKCGDREFRLKVAKLVAAKGMGSRTIFPCGDQATKDAFLAVCPGAQFFVECTLSATPTPAELAKLDQFAALKPWAFNTCFSRLSPAAAAAVKARGMRLSLWTASSPETFDQCAKQGAYNVTTTWLPPKLATPAPRK